MTVTMTSPVTSVVLERHLFRRDGPVTSSRPEVDPPEAVCLAEALADDVFDVLDEFLVAAAWLPDARQGAARMEALPFLQHPVHFPLLRLRKLRCDYDKAEVDHEKGADLKKEECNEVQ